VTPLARILHATDFSPASASAFAHALRIALDAKAKLYLVHVASDSDEQWSDYPHVRELLGRWGLFDPAHSPAAIERELGLHVAKASIHASDPRSGISEFAADHGCDLLVLSTHGRSGWRKWIESSVAEDVSRAISTPTLFVPETAAGFVDPRTGESHLRKVLVPLDGALDCMPALRRIDAVLKPVAAKAQVELLHVGLTAPIIRDESGAAHDLPVTLRQGLVVETILSFAAECEAGLIAMPTAGRHGLLDALRGSTTERVLREARCCVLAAPIA
jgi:nucleotide-binding universal stress UspA family protein